MGRLFLFALKSQSHNANDYKTKLKQFRICNHPHHPLSWGVTNRLPFATASAVILSRGISACQLTICISRSFLASSEAIRSISASSRTTMVSASF